MSIFDLECSQEESLIHLLPIAWEATTSYGAGTANGPKAIQSESYQIDLMDLDFPDAYKCGFYFHKIDSEIQQLNTLTKNLVKQCHEEDFPQKKVDEVNTNCEKMNDFVYQSTKNLLEAGKRVGIVGGDHSVPLGAIKALREKYDFAILHIDAHADLRKSYQGYTYSHASIMYNVLQLKHPPSHLVQIGIRDFCHEELSMIDTELNIHTYFDRDIHKDLLEGYTWQSVCDRVAKALPKDIYISFDIDGLSPEFCPDTGTPVPGGLSYNQFCYLISYLHQQGKKLIGFDLVEVSPGENKHNPWNANVGMRCLYKLCNFLST